MSRFDEIANNFYDALVEIANQAQTLLPCAVDYLERHDPYSALGGILGADDVLLLERLMFRWAMLWIADNDVLPRSEKVSAVRHAYMQWYDMIRRRAPAFPVETFVERVAKRVMRILLRRAESPSCTDEEVKCFLDMCCETRIRSDDISVLEREISRLSRPARIIEYICRSSARLYTAVCLFDWITPSNKTVYSLLCNSLRKWEYNQMRFWEWRRPITAVFAAIVSDVVNGYYLSEHLAHTYIAEI